MYEVYMLSEDGEWKLYDVFKTKLSADIHAGLLMHHTDVEVRRVEDDHSDNRSSCSNCSRSDVSD